QVHRRPVGAGAVPGDDPRARARALERADERRQVLVEVLGRGRRDERDLHARARVMRASRFSQRARAFCFSPSRVRTGEVAVSASSRRVVVAVTASTARSNARVSAADGLFRPLTLRTYWIAAARISSGVVGGWKL